MINIIDKAKCTGCSACFNICNKNAIYFETDSEGFVYPEVNMEKCVDCSLCEKVCPLINSVDTSKNYEKPIIKAAWNLDEEIRINSTSGGVFSALADKFLDEGGYVVGAEYTEDFGIQHTVISSKEQIKKLRQSKYAQSNLNDVFTQIKELLKNNERVLFCGTPCQSAGLKNYLMKEYDNLFIVDFICRGIVNQKIYKKYLESVEKHSGSKISKVHFKNKDFGWNRFSTKLSLKNGNYYHKDRYNDEYMIGYLKHNLYLRPCCHECKFKTLPRVSDISLGDFWGIGNSKKELDNDKGTSVVIINSDKGKKYFETATDVLYSENSTLEQVTKGNACLFNIATKGKYREYFFKKADKMDFIDLIHKIDFKYTISQPNLRLIDKLYLLKKHYTNR